MHLHEAAQPFDARRRLAYIYIVLTSIVIVMATVVEIQGREDLRATALADKIKSDLVLVENFKLITGFSNNGMENRADSLSATNPSTQAGDDASRMSKEMIRLAERQHAIDKCDARLSKLIEYGAADSSELLSAIWHDYLNGNNTKSTIAKGRKYSIFWPLMLAAGLFTVYSSRFLRSTGMLERISSLNVKSYRFDVIEKTNQIGGESNQGFWWFFFMSGLARSVLFLFILASVWFAVEIVNYLHYINSNALLATAMVLAGVLGVMSDIAKEVVTYRTGSKARGEDKQTEGDGKCSDPLIYGDRAGILMSTVGALVGAIAFMLIKGGKNVYFSQINPADISLNPFSSVLTAYILALFSPRYFKKLDELAGAAFAFDGS